MFFFTLSVNNKICFKLLTFNNSYFILAFRKVFSKNILRFFFYCIIFIFYVKPTSFVAYLKYNKNINS